MGLASDIDPLALALAPPADETADQRTKRLQDEERARRISEEIDEQIRQERTAMKKQKKPVKVLLLGQSESGESQSLNKRGLGVLVSRSANASRCIYKGAQLCNGPWDRIPGMMPCRSMCWCRGPVSPSPVTV